MTTKKQAAKTKSVLVNKSKNHAILTNCTDSPRGIIFSTGMVMLAPREIRTLTDKETIELKVMCKNSTFQRFLDNGIFRLHGMLEKEASVTIKTPTPPADLQASVDVPSLSTPVAVSSTPKVVETVTLSSNS